MRYLIISDVHANRHALDAVVADATALGFDATLCLGDLVGYGADPGAVIAAVTALAPVAMVRGNHDKVCVGLEPATLFNDSARAAAEWTERVLSNDERRTLRALPKGPRRVSTEIEICHGAPFDEDFYVFDAVDAGRAMEAASARLCFCGHTHLPGAFSQPHDPLVYIEATGMLQLPRQGPALINVGSVGQPRDGDPRASYGLLDTAAGTLALRRVEYDIAGAQKRIREAGLPEWLAARLAVGQ